MLELSEMVTRLLVAIGLGAIIGLERELVGKEAGVRTAILVCAGAAIFAMISIVIPAVAGLSQENLVSIPDRVVSNIVVGIGFLGAGIIIKTGEHVRGLTTAAVVWFAAAVGALVGLGLAQFALVAALSMTGLLFFLRKIDLYKLVRPGSKPGENEGQSLD
jgi:putative Mg2+ transporter-C (MgtC) family protein